MQTRRAFIRSALYLGSVSVVVGAVGCSNGETAAGNQNEQASLASLTLTQYRTPTCGCCHQYESYLGDHGVKVEVVEISDTTPIHERFNIPSSVLSCHTSEIGGYFVEGHVPVEVIDELLAERPEIDGIALPGMPSGSPGMGGEKTAPFVIYAVSDGEAEIYKEF